MLYYLDKVILPGLMVLLASLVAAAIIILIWGDSDPGEKEACKDIGGKYVVVGKEFSPASKVYVEIYGCIKSKGE